MPDPLFDGLYREADKLRWPASEEVRRRGHLAQVRRRVTVAAVAVLVLLTGGVLAGQALGGEASPPPVATEPPVASTPTATQTPSPTPPSASPSAEPSPTPPTEPAQEAPESEDPPAASPEEEPLAAAMLRVEDLPAGAWERVDDVDGDWSFAFSASVLCNRQLPTPVSWLDQREQKYLDGSQVIIQLVDRYPAGTAEQFMDYVRRQVEECEPFRESQGLTIHQEGFAGADSIVVSAIYENGGDVQHIFVRQGDLVTELWAKPAPDAYGVPLAQRAADRLCNATTC
jgi:hypothetical protein